MRSTGIQPPSSPLSDDVVSLRLRQDSDGAAISTAALDAETRRWLDDPPPDPAAGAAGVSRALEAFRTGRAAPFVIADSWTDEPLGLVNVQFRNDDLATVAYSVFPAARGRGVAPRAVRLAADWAFRQLGLSTLLLEIDPTNVASLRVAEKCRFSPVDRPLVPPTEADRTDAKLVFALRAPHR